VTGISREQEGVWVCPGCGETELRYDRAHGPLPHFFEGFDKREEGLSPDE
jgi:hypothetical protein